MDINNRVLIKDLKLNQTVVICGCITVVRDLGKKIFIKLRDRSGEIQCILTEEVLNNQVLYKGNYCVIYGKVIEFNNQIEITVIDINMDSKPYSGLIFNTDQIKLNNRLEYIKYHMRDVLILKSKIIYLIIDFFQKNDFVYIQTPILTFCSETGAKPFRTNNYYLSQSPQIYKQSLMIAGIERYFQVANCFRDELQRNDRQPEFTQLDFELSFTSELEIQTLVNNLINEICVFLNKSYDLTYLTYDKAMELYGSDKPFISDTYLEYINTKYCFKIPNMEFKHIIPKWKQILDGFNCKFNIVENYMQLDTNIRTEAGKALNSFMKLLHKDELRFAWITNFNLFELNEDNNISSVHHPFTSPEKNFDLKKNYNLEELLQLKARSFDLVLNGSEIGGGSIRINDKNVQTKIFDIIKAPQSMFNFMDLFNMSVPIHGGMALGLDRLISELLFLDSIKEVIAFPKNNSGVGFLEKNI